MNTPFVTFFSSHSLDLTRPYCYTNYPNSRTLPTMKLSSNVATVTSKHMREVISNRQVRVSDAVRGALLHYAHKAKTLTVPHEFLPPQNYADRFFITAVMAPSEKDKYVGIAKQHGIPISELILRCLSAWLNTTKSVAKNNLYKSPTYNPIP